MCGDVLIPRNQAFTVTVFICGARDTRRTVDQFTDTLS